MKTKQLRIDLSDPREFDRRNLIQARPGEVRLRPGFRQVLSAPAGNYRFAGGKTVRVPSSGRLWHYVVEEYLVGGGNARLKVYDEDFNVVQTLALTGAQPPIPVVTCAVLGRDMLISGPRMPPVKVLLGSYAEIAQPVPSLNNLRTALPIPRGPAVGWAGRVCVAANNGVYISDPFAPFTFISANIVAAPSASPVFGVHIGAEGALVLFTESGAWAMPEEAAASYKVSPDLSRLDSTPVFNYAQTAEARQRVFGVSRRGLGMVYPAGEEIDANELDIPRGISPRIASPDFRMSARLVGCDEGLMMSYGGAVFRFDLAAGDHGWWTTPEDDELEIVAVLRDVNGEEIFLTRNGGYKLTGNFDGEVLYTSENGTPVKGYFAGPLPVEPDLALDILETRFKTDSDGSALHSINGSAGSKQVPQHRPRFDDNAGDSWGDDTTMRSPKLTQTTLTHDERYTEVPEGSFEVGAEGPGARVLPRLYAEIAASMVHDDEDQQS
jgi:hypothetical protein